MPTVISFDGVSKRYRLGTGQSSLRDLVGSLPSRLFPRGRKRSERGEDFWALQDVSFALEAGQVLGIIGRNGAGKTTTLKLLSRVSQPTEGHIRVNGRVSALIELGAGFHPDLTGRENIYLNGAILGLSKRDMDRKFDSIVEFAELAPFIDTPVKRYSSGMYARLGFAVAAHSDPDLLLVDEVLAVGDAAFQRKCFDFIHSFVTGGSTAVFVSHNMYVMEQLCTQLIWMDKGQVALAGKPDCVLSAYLDSLEQQLLQASPAFLPQPGRLRLTRVSFEDANGNETDTFVTGQDIVVCIRYYAASLIASPHFCIGIAGPEGGLPLFMASMLVDGGAPPSVNGEGVLRCRFKNVPLMPKVYSVWGEVWGADRARVLIGWQRLGQFRIVGKPNTVTGNLGRGGIRHMRADAPIRVLYQWESGVKEICHIG